MRRAKGEEEGQGRVGVGGSDRLTEVVYKTRVSAQGRTVTPDEAYASSRVADWLAFTSATDCQPYVIVRGSRPPASDCDDMVVLATRRRPAVPTRCTSSFFIAPQQW